MPHEQKGMKSVNRSPANAESFRTLSAMPYLNLVLTLPHPFRPINRLGIKMAKKQFGDYYLGLDIGTDSVGWAVTDPDYNILKFNGKAMWGVHLFEEGKTADERRGFRILRRRYQRRKQRISLLRELLSEEIAKVDPGFYSRQDESYLHYEDRKEPFVGIGIDDKEYHKKYPTIYHLRKDLATTNEKPDIRLVYLAIHHILKYRGHFLFENIGDSDIPEFEKLFTQLSDEVSLNFGIDLSVVENISEIRGVLTDMSLGVTDRKYRLKKLMSSESKSEKAMAELLAGGKVKMENLLFSIDSGIDFKSDEVKSYESICLKDSALEEQHDGFVSIYGPEIVYVLDLAKSVYDWGVLTGILRGYGGISDSKIAEYELHKHDLKILKSTLIDYARTHKTEEGLEDYSLYKKVFKSNTANNYCNYSGKAYNSKNRSELTGCSQEEFCKFLLGILKDKVDFGKSDELKDMESRLNERAFMPKLRSRNNSLFPNALHRNELNSILTNMQRFYPFLSEKDENGLTVSDKILSLCTFKIPYYVGPLGRSSKTGWAIRKSEGRVLPWNFKDVVDVEKSAANFIDRLVSTCTYLKGEKVLPKNSPAYQRFILYNELNKITVNGSRISQDLKSKVVEELYEKQNLNRVSKKTLEKFILTVTGEKVTVGGIDEAIMGSLRSEHQLSKILGDLKKCRKLSEDVARVLTIFGDDRKMLRQRLSADFGGCLDKNQLAKLSNIRFTDWGNLSEKFLLGIHSMCPDGMERNILSAMEQDTKILQELLSKDYEFKSRIDSLNSELGSEDKNITREDVDELYCSPAVKRAIWRVVSVIKEIVKVTGHEPKKIFIETTREVRDDGKKMSRKSDLLEKYEKAVSPGGPYEHLLEELGKMDEPRLRSKKLYAYFLQLGHCAYCWSPIDLADLDGNTAFDMDHIHPQSLKTDDSVRNNMVLCCKNCNSSKTNSYPVDSVVRTKMASNWKMLKDMGLMTDEKYSRLVRSTPFTDEELSGFISRQLVETSQSVKAVSQILGRMFGNETELVYVKGSNVSKFRHDQSKRTDMGERGFYVKCRNVNDYHHAKDAYLNIVVGNVYDTKFTKNPLNYIKGRSKNDQYSLNRMFDHRVERAGVVAWVPGTDGSIVTVDRHMRRNNILFTRAPYSEGGALYDVMLKKKTLGQLPFKNGMDQSKYGAYNKITGAYFSLVEHTVKKQRIRTIEPVPLYVSASIKDEKDLKSYYEKEGFVDVDVRVPCIYIDTMFLINGYRSMLRSRTGDSRVFVSAEQLVLPYEQYAYCKKLFNFTESDNKNPDPAIFGINAKDNGLLFDCLFLKLQGKYSIPSAFSNVCKTLEKMEVSFSDQNLVSQTKLLVELLKVFQCKPVYAKLSEYGGSGTAGRIGYNKNICNLESIIMINSSITGLFEKHTDLKIV